MLTTYKCLVLVHKRCYSPFISILHLVVVSTKKEDAAPSAPLSLSGRRRFPCASNCAVELSLERRRRRRGGGGGGARRSRSSVSSTRVGSSSTSSTRTSSSGKGRPDQKIPNNTVNDAEKKSRLRKGSFLILVQYTFWEWFQMFVHNG